MYLVPHDHPILKQISSPVILPDEFDITVLAGKQMLKLKNKLGGSGLAAPQIGRSKRFFVWDFGLVINPEILQHGHAVETDAEGCLSYKGYRTEIPRFKKILVKYTNDANQEVIKELTGYLARVFQHEMDHLSGILIWETNPKSI